MRKLSESDRDSPLSVSPDNLNALAGPSCAAAFEGVVSTNGHTNGFTPVTNGTIGAGVVMGNGVQKHGKLVAKVNLPGTTLYDDSFVDREEFVRLVIQSLRDVGYMYVFHFLFSSVLPALLKISLISESAATLEAESGYAMESPEVSQFRQLILDGLWSKAEAALVRLGVDEEEGLWVGSFPPHPFLILLILLSGCQVSNKSAEISGATGS
jgi:WD repeat-containing protein 26